MNETLEFDSMESLFVTKWLVSKRKREDTKVLRMVLGIKSKCALIYIKPLIWVNMDNFKLISWLGKKKRAWTQPLATLASEVVLWETPVENYQDGSSC